MILGVLSDTHGNTPLMMEAAEQLRQVHQADHLIHLGDDWSDRETLEMAGYPVSGVPGLWCPEYRSRHILKCRLDVFGGLGVAYAHDHQDLPPLTSDVGLILIGHTHAACIGLRRGIPLMNPGHLKQARDRGRPASYGIAVIEPGLLRLTLSLLSGEILEEQRFKIQATQEG